MRSYPRLNSAQSPCKQDGRRDAPYVIWQVSIYSHLFPLTVLMKDRGLQWLARRRSCDSTNFKSRVRATLPHEQVIPLSQAVHRQSPLEVP